MRYLINAGLLSLTPKLLELIYDFLDFRMVMIDMCPVYYKTSPKGLGKHPTIKHKYFYGRMFDHIKGNK